MSFGFGVSDFLAVLDIVKRVADACKNGPGEYQEIYQELTSLQVALHSVVDNSKDANSSLNRKGSARAEELLAIMRNCEKAMEELQSLVDKHSSLRTDGKGKVRRLWDSYRIGSADLDSIRGKLTFYTSTITMFMVSLEAHTLSRIESKLDKIYAKVHQHEVFQARQDAASVASTMSVLSLVEPENEEDAWELLRRKLLDEGISATQIEAYRNMIINYMKSLILNNPPTANIEPSLPYSLNQDYVTASATHKHEGASTTTSERSFADLNEVEQISSRASPEPHIKYPAQLPKRSANDLPSNSDVVNLPLAGGLVVNNDCHLQEHKFWTWTKNRGFLCRLVKDSSFVSRELSLRYDISRPGFNANYKSVRGKSMKANILEEWDHGIFSVLNEPYGVLFSLCTGFMKRVPLREAVAEVLLQYLQQHDKPRPDTEQLPDDWHDRKTALHGILKGSDPRVEVSNRNFVDHCRSLDASMELLVRTAISFVLRHLEETGIDDNSRNIKMAWAIERHPFRALVWPCSEKKDAWLQLLKDTTTNATFAVCTPRCLAAHPPSGFFGADTSCRSRSPDTFSTNPIAPRLLQTAVCAVAHPLAARRWRLNPDQQYAFKPTRSTNLICMVPVTEDENGRGHKVLITMDMGSLGNSIIVRSLLKIGTGGEELRETSRRDGEVVTICTAAQWQESWEAVCLGRMKELGQHVNSGTDSSHTGSGHIQYKWHAGGKT